MFLDTINSRSAINALVIRCSAVLVSTGIPVLMVNIYATFMPKKYPTDSKFKGL